MTETFVDQITVAGGKTTLKMEDGRVVHVNSDGLVKLSEQAHLPYVKDLAGQRVLVTDTLFQIPGYPPLDRVSAPVVVDRRDRTWPK